jgi:hypothetical protein
MSVQSSGRGGDAMADVVIGEVSWERMIRAVDKVKERLQRAVKTLEQAQILYAVVGGNAVAAWVARVDEAAARNTRDVDLLIWRTDQELFPGASDPRAATRA